MSGAESEALGWLKQQGDLSLDSAALWLKQEAAEAACVEHKGIAAHVVWAAEAPGAVRREETLLALADTVGAHALAGAVERAPPVTTDEDRQREQSH